MVVHENESSLEVCIAILGVLERVTSVSIATSPITAAGKCITSLFVLYLKITSCNVVVSNLSICPLCDNLHLLFSLNLLHLLFLNWKR